MTGRGLAALAAAALVVVAVAVAVRPLLAEPARPAAAAGAPQMPVPAGVERRAARAARRDLRCPASAERRSRGGGASAGCGALTLARRQASCASSTRCTVDLLGELFGATRGVPLALTVSLVRRGGRWRVVEVRS